MEDRGPTAGEPALGRWGKWSTALLLLVLAAPTFCYLNRLRNALIDDAFITLQYASNLRHHACWGFLPNETANTATSPLMLRELSASLSTSGRMLTIEVIQRGLN